MIHATTAVWTSCFSVFDHMLRFLLHGWTISTVIFCKSVAIAYLCHQLMQQNSFSWGALDASRRVLRGQDRGTRFNYAEFELPSPVRTVETREQWTIFRTTTTTSDQFLFSQVAQQ